MNERKQPEALRLAEYLDLPHIGQHKSADELRRLHEVNQELLAALEELLSDAGNHIHFTVYTKLYNKYRSVIDKAEK